jgi:LPXTG-motif cell wall-anchored protein
MAFGLFADEDILDADGKIVVPAGALVATVQIDEKGHGVFAGDLPFAKYFVQELRTNDAYLLNETNFPVHFAYAGQGVAVVKIDANDGKAIVNKLRLGKISLLKQGEVFVGAEKTKDGYTPTYELRGLPGAVFNVIAAEDIRDAFGEVIVPLGTIVDTITTDMDGKAESNLLHLGRYELVEVKAPAGFVQNDERRAVTLGMDGLEAEIFTAQSTVHNQRQKAEIQLKKLWELPQNPPKDFAPWKEIQFGLYAKKDILAADGSVAIPAGALIEFVQIDENGNGKVKTDLPFGEYYLQEIKTAKGYALDETKYDVKFGDTGKSIVVISIAANNKIQRGSLKIVKTFEGHEPMAGVPFLIVGQTAFGEIRLEVKTDGKGEILVEGLPVGEYTITEQASQLTANYVLSPAQTVTVKANRTATVKLHNRLARGEVQILKIDAETQEPLAGATFGLYLNGKLVGEAKSGKDGIARFVEVPFGDYEVRELSAPMGYKRSDETVKVTVGGETPVVKLTFENERVPGEPVQPDEPDEPAKPVVPDVPGTEPPPKTGDNRAIVKTAVVVLCLAGIVAGYILLKKKKNGEEPADDDSE